MDTIDRTIGRLGGETIMKDEEPYAGFAKSEVESMKAEAMEKWGRTAAYAQSRERVARMTKEEWARVKSEGEAVDEAAAAAMRRGDAPESPAAQAAMARKYEHLRHFYEPSMGIFAGLGRMYAEDGRFKARYEAIAPGLADYLLRAMAAFARGG
jgi:MerR family transcriptional regulator, thiopeptide resistance regulator